MTYMSDEERKRREEETGAGEQIKVQRDDGSTEPFDREKLMKSVENAGVPRDQAQQIASSIEKTARPTMTMSEIDRSVSTMLERMNPDAHKNWMHWKEEHGKMR